MIDKSIANTTSQTDQPFINKEVDSLSIWRSLALRVSNDPNNLKLHTQRLLFGLENNLGDYIPGALQDLFICLKQKGLPLRQRLFNLLSPVMVQNDRLYFQRWLADDSDRNLPCYRYSGSVFQSDTCQKADVNEAPLFLEKPAFKNQLDEARYNLESGQIMKAQALLENICLKNEEEAATQELQNLYILTRQKIALEDFTKRYVENKQVLSKTWLTLLDSAQSW